MYQEMTNHPTCPQCGIANKTFAGEITDSGYLMTKDREWERGLAQFYPVIFCAGCNQLWGTDDDRDVTASHLSGMYRIIWYDMDVAGERHCGCPVCHKERVKGTIEEWM